MVLEATAFGFLFAEALFAHGDAFVAAVDAGGEGGDGEPAADAGWDEWHGFIIGRKREGGRGRGPADNQSGIRI